MIRFDPFSAEHRDDPYPGYAALRREAPVCRIESNGAFAVSRYQDVASVLRQPELFSSRAMMTVLAAGFTSGMSQPGAEMSGEQAARVAEQLRSMPVDMGQLLGARSLIAVDPPVHAGMRSLVNRGFTPRRIAALEGRIREIARTALDALAGQGEFDLMRDYAIPLPVTVIAELLGVEPERTEDFKRWSDAAIAGSTGAAIGHTPETLLRCFAELASYMTDVIAKRRDAPRDDLITTLTRAEAGEAALTPAEVVLFTFLLLVAGNETTTNLLGNAMLALLAHPEQLARVQRDPALVPALVEEVLRYDGPIQFLVRETTREVELAGVRIPAGATVMPLLGSANRDEAQFPAADRFDVTRNTQGHLAFGFGIHFCLGASLARLEARIALEELLARHAGFTCLEPRIEYVDSFLVRGVRSLRLRAEPTRGGRG